MTKQFSDKAGRNQEDGDGWTKAWKTRRKWMKGETEGGDREREEGADLQENRQK